MFDAEIVRGAETYLKKTTGFLSGTTADETKGDNQFYTNVPFKIVELPKEELRWLAGKELARRDEEEGKGD